MYHRISIRLVLSIVLTFVAQPYAPASDWGYDSNNQTNNQTSNQKGPQTGSDESRVQEELPMRAHAQPFARQAPNAVAKPGPKTAAANGGVAKVKSQAPTAAHRGSAAAPAAATTGSSSAAHPSALRKNDTFFGGIDPTADPKALSQACWGQVLELAGRMKLEDEQRKELADVIKLELQGTPTQAKQCKSVFTFWPKLASYLGEHADQRENYSCLLRALLRLRARNLQASLSNNESDEALTQEFNLISEVLGPQRLSVPGSIPFSEEAVNAYADMACFIYEQTHPGKTVDALDNRAVFATAVSQKFKDAPSQKDQKAMSAFDLSWAKFKILWTSADEKQKSQLLASLQGGGPSGAAQIHDSMLELVLTNFPALGPKGPSVASSAEAAHSK